jgi:hypothetical protein
MTPCYLVVCYRRFGGNYCLRLLVTHSITLTIELTVGSVGRFTGQTKKMATNTELWEGLVCVERYCSWAVSPLKTEALRSFETSGTNEPAT